MHTVMHFSCMIMRFFYEKVSNIPPPHFHLILPQRGIDREPTTEKKIGRGPSFVQRIKLYATCPENLKPKTVDRDSGCQLVSTHLDSQFGRSLKASSTTKITFNPGQFKVSPRRSSNIFSFCMLSIKGEAQGQRAHTKGIYYIRTVYSSKKDVGRTAFITCLPMCVSQCCQRFSR